MEAATRTADPGSKDPRMIQPRTPEYNALLAKYLKLLEHEVFKAIDKMMAGFPGEKVVMKGLNARQQGQAIHDKWQRFKNPVGIMMDYSRFDQHVSKEALMMEHSVYVRAYDKLLGKGVTGEQIRELKELLGHQLVNYASTVYNDGAMSYTTQGKRMSGDNNTGLGNVVLVCLMFDTYIRDTLKLRAGEYSFVNNGDDCILIVERDLLQRVRQTLDEFMLPLGFEIEIENATEHFEKMCFCQSHPVLYKPGKCKLVRNEAVARVKDCLNLKPMRNEREFDEWRAAIAACGLALCSGIPVMQDFYACLRNGS